MNLKLIAFIAFTLGMIGVFNIEVCDKSQPKPVTIYDSMESTH